MTPDAFWAAEMQNRRLQQEQEQYNQRMLMEGITQVAGAYGQSAGFQAQAWDKYRQGAPNAGPQSRNKYGYRYQGPQGP
jgi:hypothetical protein